MLAVDQKADARSEEAADAKAVTLEVDETDAQKLARRPVGTSRMLRKAGEVGERRPLRVTLNGVWKAASRQSRSPDATMLVTRPMKARAASSGKNPGCRPRMPEPALGGVVGGAADARPRSSATATRSGA